LAGSTIAVVVRVSVRVSVRTRSVPNLPADTLRGCPENDLSAWFGDSPDTHRSDGVTY
jgi:hypothetical protein